MFSKIWPNMVNCKSCYQKIIDESIKKLQDMRNKVNSFNSFTKEIKQKSNVDF